MEIGMLNAQHRKIVSIHASKLEVSWPRGLNALTGVPLSVEKWLQELHLEQYAGHFRKNMYMTPDRLLRFSNDELITLLEIEPVGHRRRFLAASARISSIGGSSNCNPAGRAAGNNHYSPYFENGGIGIANNSPMDTIHQHQLLRSDGSADSDGSLPLRDPNDLVSGVSSALKTAWRHTPETLINGSVTYKAVVSIT